MTERWWRDSRRFARCAGIALVIGAVFASVLRLADGEPSPAVTSVPPTLITGLLAAELVRCKTITDPAAVDARCRAAWAESRRIFLGLRAEDETPNPVNPRPTKHEERLVPVTPVQPLNPNKTSR